MTKQDVINLFIEKESDQSFFNDAVRALQKAPAKNLSLISFYNRSGFSKQRVKSLAYDVKKAWNIKDAEIKEANAPEPVAELPDELKEELAAADLDQMNYNKEIKPLAATVAKALNHSFTNQKKATLVNFLQQKKSEYGLNEVLEDQETEKEQEAEQEAEQETENEQETQNEQQAENEQETKSEA